MRFPQESPEEVLATLRWSISQEWKNAPQERVPLSTATGTEKITLRQILIKKDLEITNFKSLLLYDHSWRSCSLFSMTHLPIGKSLPTWYKNNQQRKGQSPDSYKHWENYMKTFPGAESPGDHDFQVSESIALLVRKLYRFIAAKSDCVLLCCYRSTAPRTTSSELFYTLAARSVLRTLRSPLVE